MAGTKLLPCPFCGGKARTASKDYGDTHYWRVFCDTPSCAMCMTGVFHSEAAAIAAWNTRHHFGLTDEDYNILLDEMGVSERTCRMTDRGECSECGAYIVRAWTEVHDFNGDMKRIDLRSHNYCPNCGARVAPKNSETTPKVVS